MKLNSVTKTLSPIVLYTTNLVEWLPGIFNLIVVNDLKGFGKIDIPSLEENERIPFDGSSTVNVSHKLQLSESITQTL